MSINIQTSGGLLKIGGNVTKEKVTSALGYTPANAEVETTVDNHIKDPTVHITSSERTSWNTTTSNLNSHTENSNIHVTQSDKTTWNNKSDFSGNYNDLEGKPNIVDGGEGSRELDIADSNGNVIVKVNSEGIQTPEVTLFTSAGKVKVSEELYDIDDALNNHINNPRVHFSGKFSDLEESPIVDDGRGNFAIADSSNNVAFEVSSNGVTNVAKLSLSGVDIEEVIENHIDNIPEVVVPEETDPTVQNWAKTSYTGNIATAISAVPVERKINGKSLDDNITLSAADVGASESGHTHLFNELNENPITDNGSSSFDIADKDGNIVATINENGIQSVGIHSTGDATFNGDVTFRGNVSGIPQMTLVGRTLTIST